MITNRANQPLQPLAQRSREVLGLTKAMAAVAVGQQEEIMIYIQSVSWVRFAYYTAMAKKQAREFKSLCAYD